MWETEKRFCGYVMTRLRRHGVYCTRLETASTSTGVPDLYATGCGDDWFIEFKNMKSSSVNTGHWKVKWRPGQQAWHTEYAAGHRYIDGNVIVCKCSWTFVGMKDGVALVRMREYFVDDRIDVTSPDVFVLPNKGFSELDLPLFLRTHSQVWRPVERSYTVREIVGMGMRRTLRSLLGELAASVDVPAVDDVADELGEYAKHIDEVIPFTRYNVLWLLRKSADVSASLYQSYVENDGRLYK